MKKALVLVAALAAVCVFMGCKHDNASDDVKKPIKLQLKDSEEQVESDWEYLETKNAGEDNRDSNQWVFCDTGKECYLILNYNPNNGYYMIGDKDGTGKYTKEMFRPYTVAELEDLIGIRK